MLVLILVKQAPGFAADKNSFLVNLIFGSYFYF